MKGKRRGGDMGQGGARQGREEKTGETIGEERGKRAEGRVRACMGRKEEEESKLRRPPIITLIGVNFQALCLLTKLTLRYTHG